MNLYVMALMWFIVVGIPLSTSAGVPITVTIDSLSPLSGTDCKVLSNGTNGGGVTYGNLTIAGWKDPGTGTQYEARIGTGCAGTNDNDTQNDGLRLITAVITSSDANIEHTITTSGVYTDPPTAVASQGSQVWYKLNGKGNFLKSNGGAAQGSTVKTWGYIQSPTGTGTWTQITSSYMSKTIGLTSSFYGIQPLSQPFPSPDISGNRTLKSVFKFMFKNAGDKLQIDNFQGIVVYSSTSPGEGDDAGIHVPHLDKHCPPDITCLPRTDKKQLHLAPASSSGLRHSK